MAKPPWSDQASVCGTGSCPAAWSSSPRGAVSASAHTSPTTVPEGSANPAWGRARDAARRRLRGTGAPGAAERRRSLLTLPPLSILQIRSEMAASPRVQSAVMVLFSLHASNLCTVTSWCFQPARTARDSSRVDGGGVADLEESSAWSHVENVSEGGDVDADDDADKPEDIAERCLVPGERGLGLVRPGHVHGRRPEFLSAAGRGCEPTEWRGGEPPVASQLLSTKDEQPRLTRSREGAPGDGPVTTPAPRPWAYLTAEPVTLGMLTSLPPRR